MKGAFYIMAELSKREQRQKEKLAKKRKRERDRRSKQQERSQKAAAKREEALIKQSERKSSRQSKVNKVSGIFSGGRGVGHKRFRSSFIMAGASVLLMAGGAFYSHRVMKHNEYLAQITETIFDTSLQMSKSGVGVTVNKPLMSDDGYTTYIPIVFENITSLPSDANDYSVYIIGSDGSMSYKATGQLIMYSTTGNAVLKISSPTKIENEVVGIMLRSDKDVKSVTDDDLLDSEEKLSDSSASNESGMTAFLEKYDSVYFSVNLAGKSIKRDKRLNGETDIEYLYAKFYTDKIVSNVKTEIEKEKKRLEKYYVQAAELISILQRDGYTVPDTPAVATPDGMPSVVYPVDLNSDVSTGFVDQDNIQIMIDIINSNRASSTSGSFDSSTASEVSDSYMDGLGDLPDHLVKNDGTNSGDVINRRSSSDGSRTASEVWMALTSLWETIYDAKVNIYQKQALKLYEIQLDYEDTLSSVTVGSSEKFKQLGSVDD